MPVKRLGPLVHFVREPCPRQSPFLCLAAEGLCMTTENERRPDRLGLRVQRPVSTSHTLDALSWIRPAMAHGVPIQRIGAAPTALCPGAGPRVQFFLVLYDSAPPNLRILATSPNKVSRPRSTATCPPPRPRLQVHRIQRDRNLSQRCLLAGTRNLFLSTCVSDNLDRRPPAIGGKLTTDGWLCLATPNQ